MCPVIYRFALGAVQPRPIPVPAGVATASVNLATRRALSVLARPDTTFTQNGSVSAVVSVPPDEGFGTVADLAVTDVTDTTVTVEWTQVQDDQGNPAKYQVRILSPTIDEDTYGDAYPSQIYADTDLAIGVTKSVQFVNLLPGTDYGAMCIPFRGPSGAGEAFGSFSNVAETTTTNTTQLGTITNLQASASDTQVFLSWSPAENATSHQPQYKLNSSGTWLNFGSALGGSASSVTVTSLTNDSPYNFRVVASDGSDTTNSNTANATPHAISGEWRANEPGGMTTLTDREFQANPEGDWWGPYSDPDRFSIQSDGTAPTGDSSVGRQEFLIGSAGSAPNGVIGYTFGSEPTDLYLCFYHKISANWQFHPATDKTIFAIDLSYGQGGTPFFISMDNDGGGSYEYVTWIQSTNLPTQAFNPNLDTVRVTAGQWALVEALIRHQNSAGSSDGELHLWVNGTKTTQYTNVQIQDSGGNRTFDHIKWEPVWGGLGSTLNQTQYQYIDRWYASGAF